jgi:hypothetical protein
MFNSKNRKEYDRFEEMEKSLIQRYHIDRTLYVTYFLRLFPSSYHAAI